MSRTLPRVTLPQMLGGVLNVCLRASIGAFLIDTMRHPDDPRYAGKAIPLRNLLIVGTMTQAVPLIWLRRGVARGRRLPYPVWTDDWYLSIFCLDMAGNYLDLYDRYTHFDLIPHGHGSGALALTLHYLFRWPTVRTLLVANGLHALLELQEYVTDLVAGTHNVRGAWDSGGDLSAGLLGTGTYLGIARLIDEWRGQRA